MQKGTTSLTSYTSLASCTIIYLIYCTRCCLLQQRDGILLIDYSTFICLGIIIIKVQAVLHAQLQSIQRSNTIFRSSTSISLSEYIISVVSQSVNSRIASVVQYSITKNSKLSFQVCSVLIFFFFLNLHREILIEHIFCMPLV